MLMMSNIPVNAAPEGLAPCPLTPNCVSSQASDTGHFIAPISYTGPADQAMQRMQQVLAQLERSTLVGHTATYLHFEVRSMLFRFVDDIECLLDPAAGVIHIRSASRVGLSDLGVNRRRVEHIREAFGKT
jgi:uncharacterized protein (DUF1499 family)